MNCKFLAIAATCAATTVWAHPHIFIETQVAVVFDEAGQLMGVRFLWTHDDYFSLLLTEDLGIDPEGDLVLTEEEAETLGAAVTDWPEDFTGDLLVMKGDLPLALGGVADHTATLEGGLVRESHLRQLTEPLVMDGPVTIQVFDPFYYTAYTVVGDLVVEGRDDCTIAYRAADLNKAYALVDELLYGRPASEVGPDEAFPEVGQAFADTLTLTCAAS